MSGHCSKNIGESTFVGDGWKSCQCSWSTVIATCNFWQQTKIALLMSQDFYILIPYQYKVTDGFTLKIQMSSPLLLIRTAIGCVSFVSRVHITCLWHDKGKMGSASKRMLIYVLSCTILAITWRWISETLHTGQSVCSYTPIRGPEVITPKLNCDSSAQ